MYHIIIKYMYFMSPSILSKYYQLFANMHQLIQLILCVFFKAAEYFLKLHSDLVILPMIMLYDLCNDCIVNKTEGYWEVATRSKGYDAST